MTKEQVRRMLDIFCFFEGKEANYKDSTLELMHSLIEANIAIEKLDEATTEISKEANECIAAIKNLKHQNK